MPDRASVLLVNLHTPEAAAAAFADADRSYDVTTVSTIPAACEVAAETSLDCVVSEFEVPDSKGREFWGGFRLLDRLRAVDDVPLVLYSAQLNEDIAQEAIESGVVGYLDATAGLERLVWRVDQVVAGRRAEQRAERQARIVDVVRDVNRRLVRSDDRQTLVTDVLDRLVDLEGYSLVGFLHTDGTEPVWHAVGTGADTVDPPTAVDAVQRARTTTQVHVADVSGTQWAGGSDDGAGTLVAVPTRFEETAYGVIVVASAREDDFGGTERSVLADLGENVGHALHTFDVEASLRARERELAERNRHLERFVDIVSHDLRNPLSVARGNVELALEHDAGDLEATSRALDRMDELLGDMLTIARQRTLAVDPTPVSLASTAQRAWESVDTPAATLRVEADATFEADESRLRQLFENLFRNAVEHGGDGVTVTVGPLDDEGFYVADDGPGIEADAEEVFEPGFSTNPDGTGLGLDIVADVVAAHGWTVDLHDSDAGGARFEFRTR